VSIRLQLKKQRRANWIALLHASVIAGLLWNFFGPQAPFIFGAGLSLFAAGMLIFLMNRNPKQKYEQL
jgi:hypothetical protein